MRSFLGPLTLQHRLGCIDFRVEPGAEATENIEHESDHDEIHAEVEEQGSDELDVTQHRERELERRGGQRRGAEEYRRQRSPGREDETDAEDLSRVDRNGFTQFVSTTRQVAQDAQGAGQDACASAYRRRMNRYSNILPALCRAGVIFQPMVWSAEGRPT